MTDGRLTDVFLVGLHRAVNVPSGGCEKIDFSLTSDPESEKLRARMPSKRLLRLRYTFPVKNKTSINQQNQFFQCAVQRRVDHSGCKSRPGTGSFHPVAIGASVEATKPLKPPV